MCKLTWGNCRGRSSSLSKILQIVTSTARVKHLCEMRYSATILSVTSLAEKVTMNKFDVTDGTNAPRMTPEHHQSQGHLVLHCLSMHAGTITASLPCHFCLDGLPTKHDFEFCHNRNFKLPRFKEHAGKQFPGCMIFFKRVMTPVMTIWLLFHYFATRWLQLVAMADDRHGMVHQGQNESNRTWRI